MKKILLSIVSLFLLAFVFVSSASAATTSTLLPVADGIHTNLTPSTGTNHYANVDETTCNGNTDYNYTTVFGFKDSYAISLSSIPDNSTITQISITPCASKNANGGSNSEMLIYYNLDGAISSTWGTYSLTGSTPVQLSTTNFSGLNITKTSSTSIEIGAAFNSGNKGMRLSRIAAVITYNPLAPTVTTNDVTNVTASGAATFNSTVNPNGASTSVSYRYDTVNTSCNSLSSSTSATLIGSGTSNVSPNAKIVNGLSAATTYYFCAVGVNTGGTTYGNVLSFTTLP